MKAEAGSHTPINEDMSSIELLTLFQRLLLCIIYGHIATTSKSVEGGEETGRGGEGEWP